MSGDDREARWEALEARVQNLLAETRQRFQLADTFDELEQIVDEVEREVSTELLALGAVEREPARRPGCPKCGTTMRRKDKAPRKIKTSKGAVQFKRQRWVCPECGQTLFPPG